jgi:ammonium transporter, Amt family
MVGWCSGCISGLVAATPASGYLPPWASVVLGIVTGIVCNYATKSMYHGHETRFSLLLILSIVKFWIKIDDAMDVFAEHGVAGMVGLLFNGLFATNYIIGLDGVNNGLFVGGFIENNYKQLYIQLAYVVAVTAYTFVVSALLAFAIDKIPGLHLRASEEAELLGMDDDQLGEFAYDYVEVRRDYLAWTPAKQDPINEEHSIPQGERHGIPQHGQMLEGKAPSEDSGSNAHTGIGGDRHAIAAGPEKAELHG